jgi:hypothetical protein
MHIGRKGIEKQFMKMVLEKQNLKRHFVVCFWLIKGFVDSILKLSKWQPTTYGT